MTDGSGINHREYSDSEADRLGIGCSESGLFFRYYIENFVL